MLNLSYQIYEFTDTMHYLFSPMSQFNFVSKWGTLWKLPCYVFVFHIVSNITWNILFMYLSCILFFALYDFMWPGTHKFQSIIVFGFSFSLLTLSFSLVQSIPYLNTMDFIIEVLYVCCSLWAFNFLSIIPYGFSMTSFISVTAFLSTIIFMGINLFGILLNGILIFRIFFPKGSPLFVFSFLPMVESISYGARNFSLAIRLSANMLSGHVLTKIIGMFITDCLSDDNHSFASAGALLLLLLGCLYVETLIVFLQAHIFSTMIGLYFGDVSPAH